MSIALTSAFLFLLLGLPGIGALGIQTDEALFAAGLYPPFNPEFTTSVAGQPIPIMVMSYVGTVKSFVFRPIISVFGPSPAVIRVSALVIGGFTVVLFSFFLRKIGGVGTQVIGSLLIATDPLFLLTTRYDWGPVAIQHISLMGAMASLRRFYDTRQLPWMALGFYLFGLGLWDKAVFGWSLAGLGVAAVLLVMRQIRERLTVKAAFVAFLAFALGALPLIFYNIQHDWATFRNNATWSMDGIGQKAVVLENTLHGEGLAGFTSLIDQNGYHFEPTTVLDRAIVAVSVSVGNPRRSMQSLLFILCIVLLPFMLRTRALTPALFSACFMTVAWFAMVASGGGAAIHHTILLWPVPLMFMATVLGAVSLWGRRARTAIAVLLLATALSNILVTITYYADEIRNGGTPAWSDAFYSLARSLRSSDVNEVCLLDWGFMDNLRLFHQGRLHLCNAQPVPVTPAETEFSRRRLADHRNVFITHTPSDQLQPAEIARFLAFARHEGFEKSEVVLFPDRYGRPTIEMFRLAPIQ